MDTAINSLSLVIILFIPTLTMFAMADLGVKIVKGWFK